MFILIFLCSAFETQARKYGIISRKHLQAKKNFFLIFAGTSEFFGFDVVRFEPKGLQLGVIVRTELVALEDLVELFEVASVVSDDRFRLQNGLVVVQLVASRQRPQEPAQTLHVPSLLQHLEIHTKN